jgi:hypothetical protein
MGIVAGAWNDAPEAGLVMETVGPVVLPLQAVPFSVKAVGLVLLPVHDPLNPREVDPPPAASDPL